MCAAAGVRRSRRTLTSGVSAGGGVGGAIGGTVGESAAPLAEQSEVLKAPLAVRSSGKRPLSGKLPGALSVRRKNVPLGCISIRQSAPSCSMPAR
jgi:hypothetical protein